MKILIDNGHGAETRGKRSPDGRLLEYRENRIIARGIVAALTARGLDVSLLVPEGTDISLPELEVSARMAHTVRVTLEMKEPVLGPARVLKSLPRNWCDRKLKIQ